jgi:beta-alanine degradation protein BauB
MIHSEPQYAEITPELRERLSKFRQEHKNDPMGDVGTLLLYEDDLVKIWEMKLEPGEASDLHHHEHEYFLIIDSGDLVAGIPPEDSPMDFFVGVVPERGNTVRVPKGGTEWALNVGEKTYHEVLVELKNT